MVNQSASLDFRVLSGLTNVLDKITNTALLARVQATAAGFMRLAKFVPEESNVLLLLNDGLGELDGWYQTSNLLTFP